MLPSVFPDSHFFDFVGPSEAVKGLELTKANVVEAVRVVEVHRASQSPKQPTDTVCSM